MLYSARSNAPDVQAALAHDWSGIIAISPRPPAQKSYDHELLAAAYHLLARLAESREMLAPGRAEMRTQGMRVRLIVDADPLVGLNKVQRDLFEATDSEGRKLRDIAERAGKSDNNYAAEALRELVKLELVSKIGVDSYKRT